MPKGFLQFRKTLIPGFISALLAFSFAAHAAPADTLNYQGKLSDTQGAPVADANYDFKLTLWDGASGGNCLWSALGSCGTPTAKTLATKTGIFSTELGASGDNALNLDFNSDVYLQIQVNADSPMSPRRKVNASAYSINTKKLDGQDSSYYLNASTEAQTKQGNLTVNGDMTVGNSNSDHLVIYGGNSANGDITTTNGSMTLKPQSGQNLNVNLSASGDFAVNTNQLYVDTSTGNVGIGTANPGARLNVQSGEIIFGDFADSTALVMKGGLGQTSALMELYRQTNETTAASYFDMNANLSLGYGVVKLGDASNSFYRPVTIQTNYHENSPLVVKGSIGGGQTGDLQQWYKDSSILLNVVDNNGNFGIGTSAPSTKLHIFGNSNAIRQSYDAANYTDLATDASGNLTVDPQGTTITLGAAGNAIALLPAENNTAGYTIGTSANRWKQGYFVDGIVTGSSSTTYAESGITSTYAGAYGITPMAGQDFNVSLSGSGEFRINTNQFYVDGNSGNVGIGTASPLAMFHVYGAEYVAFDRFDTFSGSHLVLRSANGTVGTPLPPKKGDKLGQVTFGGYDGSSWSAGTDVGIWSVATEDWNSGSHGSYLAFGTVADGTTYLAEHMRIDQDGKVGIGTTTPISPLEVVSTSSSAFRTIVATQYSDNQLASQFNYRKARGTSVSPQAVLSGDYLSAAYTYGFDGSDWYQTAGFKVEAEENFTSTNGGSYMRFLTTQSGSKMLTEKMRIDGSGNVGIGTSDPLEKLVVNGKVVAELYGGRKRSLSGYSLEVGGLTPTSSNNEATIYFHDWNTLMHQMAYRSGTLYWEALGDGSGNTNNTPNLSVSGSLYAALNGGRVGIGTTSPAQLLHVGSSAITDGTALIRTQDANSTCDFTAQAGGPTCGSDLRLKKDISTMTGTLDIVTRLNPVAYHWNTEASAAPLQYGFIAQEVEVLIPGLVTEGEWIDGSRKKFLSMGGMMPYVVGAIKEQQSRISANDELLDALRTETQNAFATLFSASGEQPEATILTLGDTTLETNDTLSKKLEEQKDRITLLIRSTENNTLSLELLKAGFDNQQIQLTALMDFYTNLKLGNFLALDEKNNLILPGNLTASDIEARVLAAQAIAIRNEEGREVVGKATIIPIQVDENGDGRDDETGSDGMTVEVRTQAVEEEDNIFVTARQPIAIGVTSIVDYEMFTIKAQEPVSEEVDVSWWIVGAASSESE